MRLISASLLHKRVNFISWTQGLDKVLDSFCVDPYRVQNLPLVVSFLYAHLGILFLKVQKGYTTFQYCTRNILLCPEIKILIMCVIFPTFSISGDFFATQCRREIRELREITTGFMFTLTCCMKDYIIKYVYYYYYLFYC